VLPYWILFTVFAAGAVQYGRQPTPRIQAAPLLAAAGVFVVLLIGFRYNVGADWDNYIEVFDNLRYTEFGESLVLSDPGYMVLNWISHSIGFDVWFVNLICAAIFGFGFIQFAKQQPNPWLAGCVAVPYLIIVVAMGYTRQAVAIGLIMAGLAALEKQSIIKFAVYLTIAVTFHKTAVIVIPLVALTSIRHRFVIGALMALMGYMLYNWFLESSVDKFVTNYVDAEYNSQGAAIRVAMNLVPAAIFLLFQKRFGLAEGTRKLWRNFSIAAFFMLLLLFVLPSSTVVDRLALYIIPLQLYVLSRVPDVFPDKAGGRNSQVVLLVILYSAVVQFVWLNYATHAQYWIPYETYPLSGKAERGEQPQ
jgi:hypothetical protein